jgi:HSP20 family protein
VLGVKQSWVHTEARLGELFTTSAGRRSRAADKQPDARRGFSVDARLTSSQTVNESKGAIEMSNDLPIRQGASGSDSPLSQRRSGGGLFSDLLGFDPFRGAFPLFANASNAFGVEVSRSDNGYVVEIPVAGFRPDQIDITFQDDTLIVSGKNDRRSFTRQLMLPEELDPDAISATVDHGMLSLTLGRRPETQPRRIQITSTSSAAGDASASPSAQPMTATSNGSSG